MTMTPDSPFDAAAAVAPAASTDADRSPADAGAVAHRHFHRSVLAIAFAALAGCHDPTAASIAGQFAASGRRDVDLAAAVPGDWDRVCILGPYSRNAAAARALGFEWPAETSSDIASDDGISLLVFARGRSVTAHVDYPRGSGDFSNLAGRCFPRADAKFVQIAHPARGWPGLFPAHET
jgi:hypothetical protein